MGVDFPLALVLPTDAEPSAAPVPSLPAGADAAAGETGAEVNTLRIDTAQPIPPRSHMVFTFGRIGSPFRLSAKPTGRRFRSGLPNLAKHLISPSPSTEFAKQSKKPSAWDGEVDSQLCATGKRSLPVEAAKCCVREGSTLRRAHWQTALASGTRQRARQIFALAYGRPIFNRRAGDSVELAAGRLGRNCCGLPARDSDRCRVAIGD